MRTDWSLTASGEVMNLQHQVIGRVEHMAHWWNAYVVTPSGMALLTGQNGTLDAVRLKSRKVAIEAVLEYRDRFGC